MMNVPMSGTYVYRSAIGCSPTCTSPMTGTSVPRYQNQPTARYGRRRTSAAAAAVTASKNAAAAATSHAGRSAGYG